MLAKCANSECSHVFRHFGTGKIYRLSRQESYRGRGAVMEHFWLCADCAPHMTLAVDPDGKSVVVPRVFLRTYREAVGRVSHLPEVSAVLLQKSVAAALRA